MPEAAPRPTVPADTLTPDRHITHRHFAPDDRVVVLKGTAGDELWGDSMTVVTPSWHTPTGEDGWRLRDPNGGQHTFITANPRYLVHLNRRCADCLTYLRALEKLMVRKPNTDCTAVDCGWYTLTALDQLVHVADTSGHK
ncbi:hypothetical protein ACFXA3_01240 [Streptomyces sp. NPDC059456]|uniref:hypothetical protein n=1 Tax=Streptomyces sp. NPDC059456 TaxID=3346838 RepID=UPI0036ACBC79